MPLLMMDAKEVGGEASRISLMFYLPSIREHKWPHQGTHSNIYGVRFLHTF